MPDTTFIIKNSIDTVFLYLDKPLKIFNDTKSDVNYWAILSTFVAIVSILIVIFDRIKRPRIFGKVISITSFSNYKHHYTDFTNTPQILNGECFIVRISLGVYRKDLYYSDVKLYASFRKGNSIDRFEGVIYWTNQETLKLDGVEYIYAFPTQEFLTFNTFFEKGRVTLFYVKFIIPDKLDAEIFEFIELEFIHPNKHQKTVKLNPINDKQILFDKSLLTKK